MIKVVVDGTPALAEVTFYSPPLPMRITGCGFGDADPPEYEELEFIIRDKDGGEDDWLESKLEDQEVYEDVQQQILKVVRNKDRWWL